MCTGMKVIYLYYTQRFLLKRLVMEHFILMHQLDKRLVTEIVYNVA